MSELEKIPFSDILPMGVCKFSELETELIPCRAISRIPENAESVIVILFPYYLGEDNYKNRNISKYAVPADYHKICGIYLDDIIAYLKNEFKDNKFEYFCDNSPINEVKAACLAGLGVKGENSLLINKDFGSYCFIGEIVTDMKLPVENAEIKECIKCGACKIKCPGSALISGCVNKDKCLSHITQKKGELTEAEAQLIKESNCIWGCDICQDICPMNKNIRLSPIKEFYETAKADYKNSFDYTENRAFAWRKRDVIERNLGLCAEK